MNYGYNNGFNNGFNRPSNLDWIMVQSIEQVESIAVQPNQRAWIMVQNEPVFALRTADGMGLVSTELYKFEKYEKPKTEYVTASQLADIINKLKEDIHESIISASTSATERSESIEHKTDVSDVKGLTEPLGGSHIAMR